MSMQQQQKQINAEISSGIGNVIEKKDEEGKNKEDGERNIDAIHQEPLQSSPQREICEVNKRVQ